MASFVPPLPQYNDPSYLGYSNRSSGSTAVSGAISGFANAFFGAVNAKDQIIQSNLEEDIKEGIGDVNEGTLPEDAPATQADDDTSTTVDVFSEEKTQANGSANIQTKQTTAEGNRLTQAYKAGRITPTYYWGQMAKLSKELKARYPGYGEQIDRQFQGLTGQIPANALADAKRKEYTGHLAKVAEDEKHFQSLVKQQWVQGHLPADYWERAAAGDPYSKMEVYSFIHEGAREEATLESEKAKLALAKARGDMIKDDAVGAAINRVNSISSTILNSTFGKGVVDAITEAVSKESQGVSVTPEEQQALRVQFGQLKAQIRQRQITALSAPDAEGNTYNSLIGDPTKITGILDQGQHELSVLEQMLNDGDFGLFAATLNNIKTRKAHYTNEVLSIPLYGYIQGIKDVGGTEIYEQLNFKSSFQRQIEEANRSLLSVMAAKTVTGEASPLRQKLAEAQRSATGGPEQKSLMTRAIIEQSVTALTHASTTDGARVTAAEDMFGEGNRNFLLHFSQNPKQQRTVYNTLMSPKVTEAMTSVRAIKPTLWKKYVDWAKESFVAMQHTAISGVNEGMTERQDTNVKWNPETKRFDFSLTERGRQRRAKGNDALISLESGIDREIERSVTNLNEQIALLANIIEEDGGDVTQELAVLFGALGLSGTEKKVPTMWSSARDSLNKLINEEEKEGEASD